MKPGAGGQHLLQRDAAASTGNCQADQGHRRHNVKSRIPALATEALRMVMKGFASDADNPACFDQDALAENSWNTVRLR